ncbi:MAG: amino acid ABC transporter substrate-binding protein [Candidatus Bathyarchaeia archaeon]
MSFFEKGKAITKIQATVIIAIIVIACVVGAYFALSQRTTKKTEILMGCSLSLSGASSAQATNQLNAYNLWVEEVNQKGGLYIREYGTRLPVKLIVYDDKGDATTAVKLYEKLITVDKVDVILGPYSSAIFFAVSSVAEKYRWPIIGPTAASDDIYARGYNYTFIGQQTVSSWAEAVVSYVKSKEDLKKIAIPTSTFRVAMTFISFVKTGITQANREIVFYEEYPTGTQDLTALVQRMKDANPDAVIAGGTLADNILLVRTCKELDFNPKFFYIAVGYDAPQLLEALGRTAEGLCGMITFHVDLPFPGLQEFVQKYKARYGTLPPSESADAYSTCQIYEAAIQSAESLNPESIREALLKLDIITIKGRFKYGEIDGKRWLNIYQVTYVGQVQNGKVELIWPKQYATKEEIYPKPPWG